MKLTLGALLLSRLALASKPNILFILTDDQDKHMGSIDFMPQLHESIISKGVTYPKHFCTVAICCPSRANIWTGRMPHNTNVTDVSPPYGGYPQVVKEGWNDNYLPLWMQDAGYNTYYVGKLWNYQNVDNYDSPPPRGFNGSEFTLDPYTYQYYNGMMTRNGAEPVSYKGQYITDVMEEKAHGFLDEAISHSDRPWMLTVAPIAPHSNGSLDPSTNIFYQSQPEYAARHAGLFKDYYIPRDESFNTAIDGGVSWIKNLPALNDSVIAYHDEYQRCRLRALQAVDEMVGGLVSRLEKEGLLNNTYIIYSTDNGYHIGQRRMLPGKECGYDTDINIPLFIRGPGIPENQVFDAVTSHTDLAPTFLSLAGTTTEGLDGKAIPLTKEEDLDASTEHVGVEYWGINLPEGINGYRKITRNDTKFNVGVYHNNTYKGLRIVSENYNLYYSVWCTNERELYDLTTDPYQVTNIAAHPSRYEEYKIGNRPLTQLLNRLDTLMMIIKSCKEDTCREPWQKLHPGGHVKSLRDALSPKFDSFYSQQPRVSFTSCQDGYLVSAEGPQEVSDVYQGKRRRKTFEYGDEWMFFS
ncbi:hypothetical protein MW887_007588 [Aspergillus wentii]|nr:hypothetical protein MW887_007588 [Aspergillus wentii]